MSFYYYSRDLRWWSEVFILIIIETFRPLGLADEKYEGQKPKEKSEFNLLLEKFALEEMQIHLYVSLPRYKDDNTAET